MSAAVGTRARALKCWHAFEHMCVLANGDVACSICDGRGDFVLGNVYSETPTAIFNGPRYRTLRRLMLSGRGCYCPATGRACLLKEVEEDGSEAETGNTVRSLQIEPTTACNLRCLTCLVRDIHPVRGQGGDGDLRFRAWDRTRRVKQRLAPLARRLPGLRRPHSPRPVVGLLTRGRMRKSREGTLPFSVIQTVIDDLADGLERVDLFNYGEPFLYRHLVDALRHIRRRCPKVTVNLSTNGIPIAEETEDAIVGERLLDWILFSIDGIDPGAYSFYRAGGSLQAAWTNLLRFHRKSQGTGVNLVWQYLVFRWNDTDRELERALELAHRHGITLWFEFVRTWGHSRRKGDELRYLLPHLKPGTSLPTDRGRG
jgi:pyruvate-formate lyase-activating enzyme